MTPRQGWRALAGSVVALSGTWLAAVSALIFFVLLLLDLLGYFSNPYLGLLIFVGLPAVFLAGVVLALFGIGRRRQATADRRRWRLVLEQEYATRHEALESIAQQLTTFYQEGGLDPDGADAPAVEAIVTVTQEIYSHNVFPAMRVGWGTYPNELGHMSSPGCFRCHDDEHVAEDGSVIRQDCDMCHDFQ